MATPSMPAATRSPRRGRARASAHGLLCDRDMVPPCGGGQTRPRHDEERSVWRAFDRATRARGAGGVGFTTAGKGRDLRGNSGPDRAPVEPHWPGWSRRNDYRDPAHLTNATRAMVRRSRSLSTLVTLMCLILSLGCCLATSHEPRRGAWRACRCAWLPATGLGHMLPTSNLRRRLIPPQRGWVVCVPTS